MRKLALFLLPLLAISLLLRHSAVVTAFWHAGGTMLVVVLLVSGVLFVAERARRC